MIILTMELQWQLNQNNRNILICESTVSYIKQTILRSIRTHTATINCKTATNYSNRMILVCFEIYWKQNTKKQAKNQRKIILKSLVWLCLWLPLLLHVFFLSNVFFFLTLVNAIRVYPCTSYIL